MINYQTITIDLQPDYREPVVQMYLSESDVGRPIQVNVLMQGQPYNFIAGTTVHIDLRKPSGKTVQVDGNYAVGSNVVLFNVVKQMAAEPGVCLTELSIVGDGQDPIGSKNWLTKVELSPMHAGDPSETWIEDLDELVQDAMEGHIDATLSIPGDAADAAAVGEELADLKSAIDQIEQDITVVDTAVYVSGWSQGQVNPVNGGSSSSSYHCRTATFEFDKSGNYLVTPKQGYAILLNAYNGVPSSTTFISPVINFETQPTLVSIDASYKYRWCVKKQDGTELAVADLPSDVVAYQFAEKVSDIITALTDRVDDAEESIVSVENSVAEVSGIPQLLTPMTLYPCYDHLFVNNTGNRAVIPHESIYHVNISRSLGYRVIEANVQITSDGHYFVNHLARDGTFGNFFYAVDGTDISQVAANTVTWQWIEDNVRYMSTVPKYRTRPTTLEEFLIGCKQNQLIPLLKFLDNNIKAMTERIMGKNNYIVYGGTREMAGDAVIFRWETHSTLSEILEFCDSIGKPLIYGTSNFQNTFTKEETASVIEALHNHGYMVCMSYEANEFWRQYRPLGIDFCGGTRTTNRLVTGNTYNLENIFNTNDFTITGGTVTDNVITLTENGTITCANIDNANRQIAHVDLDVDFDGVLTLTGGLGEFRGDIDFDSTDGKLIVCTAVINKPINFTLTAKGGSATIKGIKYKVSIC